jgi:hypothetical protein
MSKDTPPQETENLFNLQIKGTRIRSLFHFLFSIVQDKITTLHLSKDEIRCNEVSSNKRILFDYVLFSKNLVGYEYNYPDQTTRIRFELKWLNEKMNELKIKNKMQFTITKDQPNILEIGIFDVEQTRKDKKIKLSIAPETKIQEPPAEMYHDQPITLHKEDFLPFLKIKPTMKGGKMVKEEIEIKIQAPSFLKFTRVSDTSESEKYGIFKKDKPVYKDNFYIHELKHVFKLHPSTVIFNVYQPRDVNMPLCIGGLCGEYGYWKVYIHCANAKPIT